MSRNTFDHLVEHMEPLDCSMLPTEILETLHALGAQDPLQGMTKYQEFVRGMIKALEVPQK